MGKFMKIAAFGLPACAMLALAQPANAAEEPAGSAVKAAQASGGKAKAKAAGPKRHCLKVVLDTGTRIVREECRTRAEWAEQGVELSSKD
jgi:hypothetical protein